MSNSSGAGFLQFILLVGDIGCFVAGIANVPRHAARDRLEHRCALLSQRLSHTYRQASLYRERRVALQEDPHYREFAIRWTLRHRLPGEMTVEEYVRGQRRPVRAPAP
ncbi:MAG: hypothetical protein AAF581_05805 [Planctomycetota bacterium]